VDLHSQQFVFAPNLVAVGSHGHGSQLVCSAYLPLMLWLTARWMRAGRLSDLGWLALAGGFQMLRGHAQIAFYTWLAVGIYLVVDALGSLLRAPASLPAKIGRAVAIGGAMALAFGIAGFYNLPLRDYAAWSIRGGSEGGGVGMLVFLQRWADDHSIQFKVLDPPAFVRQRLEQVRSASKFEIAGMSEVLFLLGWEPKQLWEGFRRAA
jgi:hypothetical protein